MARRHKSLSKCGFCPHEFESGDSKFYVYPIPSDEPGHTPDFREGCYACAECFPEVRQKQIEMGLIDEDVITVEESDRDR